MFDFLGGDDDDEEEQQRRRERINDIIEDYETDLERTDIGPRGRVESREYQEYKEADREARKRTWYERLVDRASLFRFAFDDLRTEHEQALDLLLYDVDADQIAPAAILVSGLIFVAVAAAFPFLPLPPLFKIASFLIPVSVFYYLVKYPSLKAQEKVVNASEQLIMAVLYIVIFMRATPSLEGAIGFAARHLDGPVAKDFKVLLWQLDVRKYNTVEEALSDYMERWRPYNKGFVEALGLIVSSTEEASETRRNEILTEAINSLLSSTRDKMDRFARHLDTPVMVLYGLGILLPVLGIILFPLVATFLGGGGTVYYLAFLYNILIPVLVLILMKNILLRRPISFSSQAGDLAETHPGRISISLGGRTYHPPALLVSLPLLVLLLPWPLLHWVNVALGNATVPIAPGPVTLLREMMLVIAVAVPVGTHLVLGYSSVISKQERIRRMEEEFPEALFELGNALDRGRPIELAVATVAEERPHLDISRLFATIASNIRNSGMTFDEAVFDSQQGAIQEWPSRLIHTIMDVVTEATRKGTGVAARSAESISKYLKNIQETQKRLEEAVEDTISSLTFLAYVLAPVIAGVAVGMGSVISLSFYTIGQISNQTQINQSAPQAGGGGIAAGGATGGSAGFTGLLNIENVIQPGILQLIVGIYLFEIAFLIGTILVRVRGGENPAKRNVAIGKILLSSTTLYTVAVFIIVIVFGGIIRGIQL
ncbi:MAG: hypothetical protein SVW77_02655 [Candidatus Nanohaloarchaea archaeon]|nr:hypothetical protein [Candidatus Nanohaloarchaea archaeon]